MSAGLERAGASVLRRIGTLGKSVQSWWRRPLRLASRNLVGKCFPRGLKVLHGDHKPPSVFLVTALALGQWICIVGECPRGCDGTTLFHHPVKRTTWRAEPVAELRPCRGAALLGGDIPGTGSASFGLAQPRSALPQRAGPHPRRPRVPRAGPRSPRVRACRRV